MRTIEYRVQFTGNLLPWTPDQELRSAEYEFVRVRARDINSGWPKALDRAREPLGNGMRREIGAIEFWAIH